jgi:hypothetical protein
MKKQKITDVNAAIHGEVLTDEDNYAQKWLAHNPGKTMPCMI